MRAATFPIDTEGVWCEVAPGATRGGGALFLDRDGVVVEEAEYLSRVEDVVVIPGSAGVIAAANRLGIPVVFVTNQAGIARSYYGWKEFAAVQAAILTTLGAEGARVDAVYACAHHPDGEGDFRHPDHPARKPNPGMLLRAAADLGLDLAKSWLVGDKAIDIEAAQRAGLAGAMQLLTGHGKAEREHAAALGARFDVRFGRSIADAFALPLLAKHDA
jgi:D-glycero-D-manno-heptose 1,7-bisphosphate phosphatase